MIASPRARRTRAAARRTASVLASSSSSWTSSRPHRAGLLDQAAEDPLVAGQRARCGRRPRAPRPASSRPSAPPPRRRRRRTRPARRTAADRRRPRGTARSRRRPSSPASERRDSRRPTGPPGCRSRSPCGSAARDAWPSALTATLPLWEIERHRARARDGSERVAPQRGARVHGDDPVAVGAAHRQRVAPRGGLDQLRRWQRRRPTATSAKPALNTTAPPHPRAPAWSIAAGTPAAGSPPRPRRRARAGRRATGTHGRPMHLGRASG